MSSGDTYIVINKYARRVRREHRVLEELASKSMETPAHIKIVHPAKFSKTVRDIALKHPKRIIVAGGDGTVTSAVHMLAKSKIELGVIPAGTTNSFARSLDIPLKWPEAMKVAVHSSAKSVNTGSANGHHFTSVAAIGLSERVASTIPDNFKKRLGRAAYFIWGARKLIVSRAFKVEVKTKEKTHHFNTHQLVVANAKLHGSLPIAKEADIKHDQLVLVAFGRTHSKAKHLRNLYLYLRKKHQEHEDVLVLSGSKFSIRTNPRRNVEIDGEVKSKTPVTIKLEKSAIKIAH